MRIALLALTGIGNSVLTEMCAAGFPPTVLVTRKETGPYPYGDLPNLADEANRLGIPVMFDGEGERTILHLRPDLVLTATYHRILTGNIIASAPHAMNIHPSLLPSYRGPSPIFWTIRNGEATTGVTVHKLSADVDAGDILLQLSLEVTPLETQGTLRHRLAILAATAAVETISRISKGGLLEAIPQNTNGASYYPRFAAEQHGAIDIMASAEEIERHVRALLPWPGARFDGRRILSARLIIDDDRFPIGVTHVSDGRYVIRGTTAIVELQTAS